MRFEVNCAKSHHRVISDGLLRTYIAQIAIKYPKIQEPVLPDFKKCRFYLLVLLYFIYQFYVNVWFQKISIPLPRKTLWFAPPQDFPFQGGLWWPPLPPGISRIFKQGLLHVKVVLVLWKNRKWILTHLQKYGLNFIATM